MKTPILSAALLLTAAPAVAQVRPLIVPHPSSTLWNSSQAPWTPDTIPKTDSSHAGAYLGAAIGAGAFLFLLKAGCGISEDSGCASGRSTLIAAFSGGILGLLIGGAFEE